ncbi:MAG: Gfo/Idh/MocA family oxidoreductase [Bryobacteraceae bacterium]|nr:Gfo/Idh/MocA family oxidoreductase [Bryobacteraceae bacterium]
MRIAVAGLGFMGSTHIKALQAIPEAQLFAVVSDVPEKLAGDLSAVQGNLDRPGEKHDFSQVRKYRDIKDALRDPDIEAFDLCLPTHLHAEIAIEALRAGKHVLVEKPMALDGAEAEAMIKAARESGRILMVAQVLRFFPAYVPLREFIDSGRLGKVKCASFRRRCAAPTWSKWLSDTERSGGAVVDLLVHDIDMCLHLFGLPEAVSATGHEDLARGIDWISARLHYPNVPEVVVAGGWLHPKAYPFVMEYTVTFEEGTVDYSSAYRPPALYRIDGCDETVKLPETDGYEAEIRYFIECCRENRQPEFCPPEMSAAAVKLARLLRTARAKDGELVPCKL